MGKQVWDEMVVAVRIRITSRCQRSVEGLLDVSKTPKMFFTNRTGLILLVDSAQRGPYCVSSLAEGHYAEAKENLPRVEADG
jgi:hypothetical protein